MSAERRRERARDAIAAGCATPDEIALVMGDTLDSRIAQAEAVTRPWPACEDVDLLWRIALMQPCISRGAEAWLAGGAR